MIGTGLPAIHPGEFLAETLDELGVSQAQFARAIGVSPMRISHMVKGTRPVTAELALLFGRALRQTPQYWLNLQAAYDLKAAEATLSSRLAAVSELALGRERSEAISNQRARPMRIVEVFPQPNYILTIVADDGRVGQFDISPYLKYEAFEDLRRPSEFVKVINGGYFVEWACGADLSADTIEARWQVVEEVIAELALAQTK